MNTTVENRFYDFLDNEDLDYFIVFVNDYLISSFKNSEPIPKINTEQIENLSNVLRRSTQKISDVYLYKTFESKIAFIFYTIIKNHYLENGNKRMASMIICLITGIWAYDEEVRKDFSFVFDKIAQMAIYIAESKPEDKDIVLENIELSIIDILKSFTNYVETLETQDK